MTYIQIVYNTNSMGITSRTGTSYPSGVSVFNPSFHKGSCCSIFRFVCVCYVDHRFSFSPPYCWSLHFLSFIDCWLLMTTLISSNFSYALKEKSTLLTFFLYNCEFLQFMYEYYFMSANSVSGFPRSCSLRHWY